MVIAVCRGLGGGVADIDLILDWTPRRLFAVYQELTMIVYQDDAARQGVSRYKARQALVGSSESKSMTAEQQALVERDLLN